MRYLSVVKLREKADWWLPGARGRESEEELFNGHRFAVLQDEKVLGICYTTI